MAEIVNDKKVFSLLEVAQSIQKTIAERYQSAFWVKAEMNKLNHYSHSGHCYPELVQKTDGRTVAQMKATLWKNDFIRINQNFLNVLHEPIKDGITILFYAAISFDPQHGLSLRIIDIDPVFSLGELEREKRETIERLQREGIYDRNKKLTLSILPQRIAIISVETSKGFADYLKVLEHNAWGYKFFNVLFPALLQGDRSVASIVYQLNRIRRVAHHFDVVAIVRGGGGDVGLSSYNHYALAREICLFPIPVFTGIGHSTNETVSEMVSFRNSITPTALADFLLQQFHNFSVPVKEAEQTIVDCAMRMLNDEKLLLTNTTRHFRSVSVNTLLRRKSDVRHVSTSLLAQANFLMKDEWRRCEQAEADVGKKSVQRIEGEQLLLEQIKKHVALLDPKNVLRRGFSITRAGGKAVKSFDELEAGAQIITTLSDGTITSEVKTTNADQS